MKISHELLNMKFTPSAYNNYAWISQYFEKKILFKFDNIRLIVADKGTAKYIIRNCTP